MTTRPYGGSRGGSGGYPPPHDDDDAETQEMNRPSPRPSFYKSPWFWRMNGFVLLLILEAVFWKALGIRTAPRWLLAILGNAFLILALEGIWHFVHPAPQRISHHTLLVHSRELRWGFVGMIAVFLIAAVVYVASGRGYGGEDQDLFQQAWARRVERVYSFVTGAKLAPVLYEQERARVEREACGKEPRRPASPGMRWAMVVPQGEPCRWEEQPTQSAPP